MTAEARLLSWLSVAVGIVAVAPTVRDMWREEKVRRASLAEQHLLMATLSIPEQGIPGDMLHDLREEIRQMERPA